MSYKYYPITGIKDGWGPNGQVPTRRDFDEWSTSKDPTDKTQFILYLLALKSLQAVDPANRDSYFQIAGIHGYPYIPWDEPSVTQTEIGRKGYCVHANNLFPPWHRPYMLLYEQRLYEIMVNEIIPRYPAYKDKYLEAARTWRLPFWDFAKNPRIPQMVRYRKVTITFGGEPKMEIENPLYQFRMPNEKKMKVYGVGPIVNFDGGDSLEYGECIATSRCPTKDEVSNGDVWANGVVHDNVADDNLSEHSSVIDESYGSAAELVYRLMTYPMDYAHFATLARDEDATSATASRSSATNDINIEFIHNNLHYWVGGMGGHMSQIPVATFDPCFWLLHCNIDRLFAIWQTLNPDKWFETDIQRYFDQKIVGSGALITNKTPLRPFHKDTIGTVWTPDDCCNWFKLGYTYPELLSGKESSFQLLKMINETYGITRREAFQLAENAESLPPGVEIIKESEEVKNGVKMYDYALNIKYSKFALGGKPFNIEVFLRQKGAEKTYQTEDFITNVFNFSQSPEDADGEEVCSNCKDGQSQNVQASAYVPMTSYLLKLFKQKQLDSLEPLVVEEVLSRMYWRIVDIGGDTIPKEKWEDTMGLKIGVSQTQMSYSPDPSKLPQFNPPKFIESLGTGSTEASIPAGVVGNNITVSKINKLSKEVSAGGSIVFTSPSMNLKKPAGDYGTGIALLNWDPNSTADALDTENYDILLSIVIKSRRGLVQCNHKLAGKGYNLISEFTPSPWFSERPKIRVDIKEDQLEIYVDGRKVHSYNRAIKKGVTHVHYYSTPSRAEPVMAREITANTYDNTATVP
ncbi:tyrosinase [Hypoxylon argillaceum]|nr:tyrosinase [Hypoxylon argillaceum]